MSYYTGGSHSKPRSMKSTAVYKILREVTGPWAKGVGFKGAGGGMLSFAREAPSGGFLTFWFQCSQDGWDAHAGSKFTLEFQQASKPGPGHGTQNRRFAGLLADEEREQVRRLQNQVIGRLHPPPPNHWIHSVAEDLRRHFLAKFEAVATPYRRNDDVWLRYASEDDVRLWAEFLLPLLPRMLDEFASARRAP